MNILLLLVLLIILILTFNKSRFLTLGNTQEVYVVSFAHNCCTLAMENLEKTAYEHGVKKFFNMNIDSLEAPESTKEIIKNNRGAGFWCFKPFAMEQISKIIPEDSILIYADSSTFFIHDFNNIIDFINTNNILCFKHDHIGMKETEGPDLTQAAWTKMNAVKHLGYDIKSWCNNDGEKIQFMAAFVGVKNNKIGKELISDWKDLMSPKKLSLYDDSISDIKNCGNFKESRHDQQILSLLLYKKYNNIDFPTYDRKYYGWVWHEIVNGRNRFE